MPPGQFMVDAHEDIACHCQENGRDLLNSTGCHAPVMITLQGWQQVGMRLVCGTLFVPHEHPERRRRYLLHSQWEIYRQWFDEFPEELVPVRTAADLRRLAESGPVAVGGRRGYPVGIVLLMEGLELLDSPAELQTWWDRGVRLASLTWNGRNRYASGCSSDGAGLTPAGIELLLEFERLGMVLDLAHLCDAGIENALNSFSGNICSTHSNARSITQHQRNLTDAQAREVARRGGMSGLNLLAPFVKTGWRRGDRLPTLGHALDHVDYLAQLCGFQSVGLGSDLDGGLVPDNTVDVIDEVSDLELLCRGLEERGWDAERVAGFRGGNWWRFLERCLPA